DLSYDFATRAQVLHALLTGDAGPLRLSFRWMLEAGVQPVAFVHDLQNHDELTFQLTEPEGRKDETFAVGGRKLTGRRLKDEMLAAMRSKTAGDAAPYNRLYRPEKDGLATTFAGFVAPALGVRDPYAATPEQVRTIARGHLLLAAANVRQPAEGAARGPQGIPAGGGGPAGRPGAADAGAVRAGAETARPPARSDGAKLRPRRRVRGDRPRARRQRGGRAVGGHPVRPGR